MQLSEITQPANFKNIEGREYLWKFYGPNTRTLDFSKTKEDNSNVSCVFNTKTQQVFEVTICTKENKFYRWIDPNYIEACKKEFENRNISFNFLDENKEHKWIDLDNTKDIFRKIKQVIETGYCDNDVTIELDLDDKLILELCLMAHEKDITLNVLIKDIIHEAVENAKKLDLISSDNLLKD